MTQQGWTATGVIEAPLDRVAAVLLKAEEGPISKNNAPLLQMVPGAGPLLKNATLKGGPDTFTVQYGNHPGGTVELDRDRHHFVFQGGYKFRAEYHFGPHPDGTLLTYRAVNVAPAAHQNRALVRFQFWLSGKLKVGLRSGLRRIAGRLGCRAYPGA